jgi:poly(A) polymerase
VIQKFINKLLGKGDAKPGSPKLGKRVDIAAAEHRIDPSLLDDRAVDVVRTLKNEGFEAYIVGGAVRDLLLGLRPKDFDVATNATPEEVKRLFRRAFIIGRRFRIVHVVYGRGREHEVIEVSTFRAYLDSAEAKQISGNESTGKAQLAGVAHAVDGSGRVLRDNVWGPMIEDAVRRDFTVNAMYYDPITQIVVDYHKGFADIQKRVLRLIGDPATRYREDPVRLIRAVRFAAKLDALGFKIGKKTFEPVQASLALLADVPQSRLFDEMLKLLQTGHSLQTIAKLRELKINGIYPLLDLVVQRADDPLVKAALADTDRRIGEDKGVSPSFLLACVLWSDVNDGWQKRQKHEHAVPALLAAIDSVFDQRIGDVSGRGRLAGDMREIWVMQPRFERRTGSTPFGLVQQPRFRAAFDFLRLRADAGELPDELATWWEDFSLEDDAGREAMVAEIRAQTSKPQRVKAAPKRDAVAAREGDRAVAPSTPPDVGSDTDDSDAAFDAPDAPARKRRRRGGRGRRPGGAPQFGDGSNGG